MKKTMRTFGLGLGLSLILLGSQAYAAVDTSSPFYRNSKTRAAYQALTDSQRQILDAMNTNNDKKITMKEMENYGGFSFPIVRGQDWLYPFMIDRDGDGVVGEGYGRYGAHDSKTDGPKLGLIAATEDEEPEEKPEENEEATNTDEADDLADEKADENSELVEFVDDEADDDKEPDELSEADRIELEASVQKAQETIDAAEYVMENYPNTVKNVLGQLKTLIESQKTLISRANTMLGK